MIFKNFSSVILISNPNLNNRHGVALIELREDAIGIPTCLDSLLSPYGNPQSSVPESHITAEYNLKKITSVVKREHA